ncbi:DMT family transporter [Salinimonas chungwhensis]|uniref:DMT family transporter n=1 Tax=Salinimonas chungwhensis TaxID=265425 RepID=UPI000372E80E
MVISASFRVSAFTTIAMLAFAANSLLCRMALTTTSISPATFTSVRLASGAVFLFFLTRFFSRSGSLQGSWSGALLLFTYAAGFSFAYIGMNTGTGALLLFGAVQLTMLTYGLLRGERFLLLQWAGFVLALSGLLILLLPGAKAPAVLPAFLMIIAGVAWGLYSLKGKSARQPLLMTSGNFVRALPFLIFLLPFDMTDFDSFAGVLYAVSSGALASGAGYAVWYKVLPQLSASMAATLQLSVPVIAMLLGWAVLSEAITLKMIIAAVATLGGVGLVIHYRAR